MIELHSNKSSFVKTSRTVNYFLIIKMSVCQPPVLAENDGVRRSRMILQQKMLAILFL